MSDSKKKLGVEPYKGVRDFYPEDMFIQKYLFSVMRKTVEKFGYVEYNASILEPTELYKSKTSDEIVNEQTYSFKDRGDRDVTLRPEMTPTVARMVAARERELGFLLRWYSIPNVFRYEQPQRGRLREHWQLNVDLFGSESLEADIEMIVIAYKLMKAYGAKDSDFQIKVNNRKLLNSLFSNWSLSEEQIKNTAKLLDKKNKLEKSEFEAKAQEILGNKTQDFLQVITATDINTFSDKIKNTEGFKELQVLLEKVTSRNIQAQYDPAIVRGFDYYTGNVFEVFDTNPENKRSLFGGGRYNNLTGNFGGSPIPAVGFGMGDVTLRDFLETRNLLPEYKSPARLYVGVLDEQYDFANSLAAKLRDADVNVFVNYEKKDIGDHYKLVEKRKIPYAVFIGSNEVENKKIKIRDIATRKDSEEFRTDEVDKIVKFLVV